MVSPSPTILQENKWNIDISSAMTTTKGLGSSLVQMNLDDLPKG